MKSFNLDLSLLGIADEVTVTVKAPPQGAAPRAIEPIDLGIPVALVLMGTPLRCKCCGSLSFKEEGVFAEIRYRNYTDYTPLTPANSRMFDSLPRRRERLTERFIDFCQECWDFDDLFKLAINNPQLSLFSEDNEMPAVPTEEELILQAAADLHKTRRDPFAEDNVPSYPLDLSALTG